MAEKPGRGKKMLKCPKCGGEQFKQYQTVSEKIEVTEDDGDLFYGDSTFCEVCSRDEFICVSCGAEFDEKEDILAYIIEDRANRFWDGERWNPRQLAAKYTRETMPISLSGDENCTVENYYKNSDADGDWGWGDEDGTGFALVRRV